MLREAPALRAGGSVWPLSQAIAAAADLRALDGDAADTEGLLRTLRRYRDGDGYLPHPRARRRYFDDNAWIGLALIQLHLQTRDERFLRHARRALAFVRGGEDPSGGVRWVEGRRSRNTCATAPAAELALQVHLIGGDAAALSFAERSLEWLDATLGRPDGLYADRIDGRGRIEPAVWSYNQGAVAGAHILRWRVTGEARHRELALATAAAVLRFLGAHDRLWRQPPVFNAICLRNLLALDAVAPVRGLLPLLDGYLERVWTEARDPDAGLLTRAGIGTYEDGRPAIDQAGLVQLFALRAWAPTSRTKIC